MIINKKKPLEANEQPVVFRLNVERKNAKKPLKKQDSSFTIQ